MIVIENISNKWHKIECKECGAILNYTDDDIECISNGWGFECPNCKKDVIICDYESEPNFPINFFHFSKESGASEVNEKETKKYIDRIYKTLKDSKEKEDFTYVSTGDTMVWGCKYTEDGNPSILIWVTKNYWEYDE